jgi:hypothetical protein
MNSATHFYMLIFTFDPGLLRSTQTFWRLLNQSSGKSEKTVSNRVIKGKSQLAITGFARNNVAVFRVGSCSNKQLCGMTSFACPTIHAAMA